MSSDFLSWGVVGTKQAGVLGFVGIMKLGRGVGILAEGFSKKGGSVASCFAKVGL